VTDRDQPRKNMTARKVPDIAIIGAGLGGLSAAIHLRLAGHAVTVFEAAERPGGRANRLLLDGIHFDTGPTLLNYPWVFEDLFRAAGRELDHYVKLHRVDPSIKFYWPDGQHLTLSSRLEFLREEFEQLEKGAAGSLDRFLQNGAEKFRITFAKLVPNNSDNPVTYFSDLSVRELLSSALWRSMYKELRHFFNSRYILEALGSYAMYLGGSPFRLPGLFTILPYGELSQGLWLPEGGIFALVEAIERLARELGVVIYTQRRVRRIEFEGGEIRSLKFDSGEVFPCRMAVSNVDLPLTFEELLGMPAPRLVMSPSVITFYWVVRRRPAELGHHTIFLPSGYRKAFVELLHGRRIPAEPAFYVASPAVPDAPAGIFVLIPVPLESRLQVADWNNELGRLREFVFERLRLAGVELNASSIQKEAVFTPEQWRMRFGLFRGSAFGAAHTLSQMGPFRPCNYSRKIRGLYFTGASTTPGTGLPMVVLSGMLAARRIASHVR